MDRAYSLLTIKAIDAPTRRISGIASTPELDRQGDQLDMAGVTFRNPVPLLFHHRQHEPIGTAILTATPDGITFDATLPTVDEPGPLKTRVDDVWQSLKYGVLSGASVGLDIARDGVKVLSSGVRQILRAEICELSVVTIPANRSATILTVKSLAADRRMESPAMTAADHVATLTTKRAETIDQMEGVLADAAAAGRPMNDDEVATHRSLAATVTAFDADLERWKAQEAIVVKAASPILTPKSWSTPTTVTSNLEPGILMARYAIAKLAAKFDGTDAATYAQTRWRDTPQVSLALKAAVAAGNTTHATWANPLVNQAISDDFLPLLRAATILGKITGLKNVPFNVKIPSQTGTGTVNWVGQGLPKPVSAMAFASETLDFAKVAGIVVLTQELVRFSNPKAEAIVRDAMVKDIAAFLDVQFTNPAVAAVANLNPASITNGAPTAAATVSPLADILGLINHFITNGLPIDGLTFIMSPANAFALAFRTNTDGSAEFPGIGLNGGSWRGVNFIVSSAVGALVIALLPSYILYADDGGVTLDASTEASIQMDSAPVDPVATTVMVSMFQSNMVAIRAERYATWKRINTNAVKYLTATAWPAPSGGVDVSVSTRSAKDK